MAKAPTSPDDGTPAPEPRTTHVTIHFDKVLGLMAVGVRRASAFMALGTKTAADTTIVDANLEANFQFKFFPQSVSNDAIAEIRSNFGEWVLGNALKELDQFFSVFLDEVNRVLTISAYSGRSIEQEGLDAIAEFSDQSSVAVKLDALKQDHGVESELRDHLAGLSKARNALSHNLGFVRERQLTSPDALDLSWLGMDLVIGDQVYQGVPEGGIHVEGGGKVEVRVGPRNKRFALGAKVELTPTELSEICFTYWNQAVQIIQSAEKIVRSRIDQAPKPDAG